MGEAQCDRKVQSADAIVVGAGFAGLYMVHRLRSAGFSVLGLEAAGDVGGTWYWNRYPGARCDIPSLLYCYTWSEELRREWRWSEKYATQPEILAYAEHVADRFGLRDAYRFHTRVTAAQFDEPTGEWCVQTDQGDRLAARFLIMATGCLSVPRVPDIAGSDCFEGRSLVTGLWPHEGVDFTGKKVAVIGTGSSAIQSIPLIARDAQHVHIFQRTPNFSLPAFNRPLEEAEIEAFEANFPAYMEALRTGAPIFEMPPEDWVPDDRELAELVKILWDGGGLVSTRLIPHLLTDERTNRAASDFVRARIREIVADRALAERLLPRDFPIGAKRACVDTDYYATYNRANVSLVDLRETPLVEIDNDGVRTSDAHYPVDLIVYALGFDAITGALDRIDIRGRGGLALRDAWKGGPATYLGLAVAGFPNLFTITGPGSPSVLINVITAGEQHVDWVWDALVHMRQNGWRSMEPDSQAQEAWTSHVAAEADKTLYSRANSWYLGANVPGKPRVFMPYVGEDYKPLIDREASSGYPGFRFSKH